MDNSSPYVRLWFKKELNISCRMGAVFECPLDLIFKATVEAVLRNAVVAAGF